MICTVFGSSCVSQQVFLTWSALFATNRVHSACRVTRILWVRKVKTQLGARPFLHANGFAIYLVFQ